jgi:hypothetical protein
MDKLHKELKRVEFQNKHHLELISNEMNSIKAKLCVFTAVRSNPITLSPPDSNARSNSAKSAGTVNVRNIRETATPNNDVLINCNGSAHGNECDTNSATVIH